MRRKVGIVFLISIFILAQTTFFQEGSLAAEEGNDITVREESGSLVVTVPPGGDSSGYVVQIDIDPFEVVTSRNGEIVLASGEEEGNRFNISGTWYQATKVTSWDWDGTSLELQLETTSDRHTMNMKVIPENDRYRQVMTITEGSEEFVHVDQLGVVYDLSSAGHWYGHGEAENHNYQPWPLDSGHVRNTEFGPASYWMIDPFWFTSKSVGLWVDTYSLMDVSINQGDDGLAKFFIKDTDIFEAEVFVEDTPRDVYDDYIGITGTPEKSDNTYEQYELPMWNTWHQYYTEVDQAKVIQYAEGLAGNDLDGHAVQIDDKWESNYGNFTFDKSKFPDPKAMSDHIHDLGFDLGLWVTLWINTDSENYKIAEERGYLLNDAQDESKTCQVTWWNGVAGIVDLANPEAFEWYENKLKALMEQYGIDGFKFDTRFFDEKCAPREGFEPQDYLELGAELADQFDLQASGIRISWTGSQKYGFVTRQIDKYTDWGALQAAVTQNLAISTIGYPFVATDMIGGSLSGPPPQKETLIRWAQAASLMPIMYASTSPLGMTQAYTGETNHYDNQTVALYRAAIEEHKRLTPYIWNQVERAVATGEPIMKPLFFQFPDEETTYTIDDQWLLGDTIMAAPVLTDDVTRNIYVPSGDWLDVRNNEVINGPTTISNYEAPLQTIPVFVRLGTDETEMVIEAFQSGQKAPLTWVEVSAPREIPAGTSGKVEATIVNAGGTDIEDVSLSLDLPEGWTMKEETPASFAEVSKGEQVTVTYEVTPTSDTSEGIYAFAVHMDYSVGKEDFSGTSRFDIVVPDPDIIPQSKWSLHHVDSEHTEGEDGRAINAFDGNPNTYWHTNYLPAIDELPHEIQIDLGETHEMNGFRYLPRNQMNGSRYANGIVKEYEFYVSMDGENWGAPVAKGTFASDNTEKEIQFNNSVVGRYIRFVALSEIYGQQYTTAAELNVLQTEDNLLPKTLEVNKSEMSLSTGEADDLQVSWVLGNQNKADVTTEATYTSLDPDIATVDNGGTVTAVAEGITTVKIEYENLEPIYVTVNVGADRSISAASMKSRVEQYEEAGEFKDDSVARSLKVHLTAVSRYEEKELADKVIKHMENFIRLLDHQRENGLISGKIYNTLRRDADSVIKKW